MQREAATRVTLAAEPTMKVELSFTCEEGRPLEGAVRLEIRHGASDVLPRVESVAGNRAFEVDLEPLGGGYRIWDGRVGSLMEPLVELAGIKRSHVRLVGSN